METSQPAELHDPSSKPSLLRDELPIHAQLENARTSLLDLSARNRLLNIPRSGKTKTSLDVIDESSREIYRLLVREERSFTFAAGRPSQSGSSSESTEADEIMELAQPEDDSVDDRGVLQRHADTVLQTRMTSKGLQKRLLEMYQDAVTLEQEQGVNILYLALGTLKWIDPKNKANIRYAPLVLVPVLLERGTAAERFRLRARHEEVASNLSLEAFLEREHQIRLPDFDASEDFDPSAYCRGAAEAIAGKPDWAVQPDDVVLGFFSFAKFLMYRDLDPECWPAEDRISEQPLVRSLLRDGFAPEPLSIPEDAYADDFIMPRDMLHVTDADTSQMKAIHEARQGRSFIIQGPPGTGKSQTIANIVAAAVADGKTVLFVAEKMVALSVVKSRLDRAGVGDACLELHSNKANKRALLQELRRTWELGAPQADISPTLDANLEATRGLLNEHAAAMHAAHPAARLSAFEVIGELCALLQQGHAPVDFDLPEAKLWTPDDVRLREEQMREFAQRITEIGLPSAHPWRGVGALQMLPTDVGRLLLRLEGVHLLLFKLKSGSGAVAAVLQQSAPERLSELVPLRAIAERVAAAPPLHAEALGSPQWETAGPDLQTLLLAGSTYAALWSELRGEFAVTARENDFSTAQNTLTALPPGVEVNGLQPLAAFPRLAGDTQALAAHVAQLLGTTFRADANVAEVRTVLATAEGVLSAPDASPEAFASAVWKHGVDRARDLAEAAATLEAARHVVGEHLSPTAWDADLSAARQALATHGTGMLRFLSGEWRHANRLVRSFLQRPDAPLADVLSWLDAQAQGRAAAARLHADADFGRQAFGAMWREDRSAASSLQAMVSWMQGLGALRDSVREVVAQGGQRQDLPQKVSALKRSLAELEALLAVLPAGVVPETASSLAELSSFAEQVTAALRSVGAVLLAAPADVGAWAQRLEKLRQLQEAHRSLEHLGTTGQALFGDLWNGAESEWSALEAAAAWIAANKDLRLVAAAIADRPGVAEHAARLVTQAREFQLLWQELLVTLETTEDVLFASSVEPSFSSRLERLQGWLEHPEQLSRWVAYRAAEQVAQGLALSPLVERLQTGQLAPANTLTAFRMAYFEALLRDLFRLAPSLAGFDGEVHSTTAARFVELDRARIAASRVQVVRAHHKRMPAGGGIGPVGVLRGEISKRSRHMPIRQLMTKAAPAVQALKPVLMMSPLSIAQFLPPGKLHFDMLVMDEASQIQPVDALGAIARCRQVIVVGDERQLPPTRFFAKLTADVAEQDDEDDTMQVGDSESVLGLFTARGLPQRMLRWHYRSRHQSLIAVSNAEFYENKLFVIPSPFSQEAGRGVRFQPVENGVFFSEANSTETKFANPVEARAVAEAVVRHALEHPERSLGVATFSVRQRRAILDEIERLRRMNPATEAFFGSHAGEPFFVKNLENVQGDERDVIFISVGYGRDPQGKFAMRFGPLGMEGGERRLNVLISRAKLQCVVFASITDEDLDPERIKSKGVYALKLFLHFARTGRLELTKSAELARQRSTFAEQAAQALRQRGYVVHPNVGLAGCFVDLGIIHPDDPSRYLLGVEFDGPSYVSAKSSRDRDRLRREVLEMHEWTMHRVWAADWLHRPKEQVERIAVAVEAARQRMLEEGTTQSEAPSAPLEVVTVEREGVTGMGLTAAAVVSTNPYVEAALPRPAATELHDTPTGVLARCVAEVVAIEGPIHEDEVIVRLRTLWGLQRTGPRIQAAAGRAIEHAIAFSGVLRAGSFLSVAGNHVVPRDRSHVASLTLRKPEMLPPAEIEAAILAAVTESFGGTEEEIVQIVARSFGYAAKSALLRQMLLETLHEMKSRGILHEAGDLVVIGA